MFYLLEKQYKENLNILSVIGILRYTHDVRVDRC